MASLSTAERLVEVARRILTDEGVTAVTMRRVAAEVGLTTMATYQHFQNRAALLRAVADESFAELGALWDRRGGADVGFEGRFFGLLTDFLDFALSRPNLYRFLMTEQRAGARRFPEDFRTEAPPGFGPVVAAVEQGMAEGVLREDDALEATLAVTAQAEGLVQLYLGGRIGMSEPDFRALCERTAKRMLDGLRTH